MTDISAELAALPKMPDVRTDAGRSFLIEALEARLAIAEKLLLEVVKAAQIGEPLCNIPLRGLGYTVYDDRTVIDARAYLAHRAKE